MLSDKIMTASWSWAPFVPIRGHKKPILPPTRGLLLFFDGLEGTGKSGGAKQPRPYLRLPYEKGGKRAKSCFGGVSVTRGKLRFACF